MYGTLFKGLTPLDEVGLTSVASSVGVIQQAWSECRRSSGAAAVNIDFEEARRLGLSATPSFLVGRIGSDHDLYVTDVLVGAKPLREFEIAIDRARLSSQSTPAGAR
jgi:hypothetical protein